uniref:Uncharacterized protein n=1 Tax=Avena sativa TaxID=4498 RepID=A0ACD5V6Z4_AVESA
MKQKIVIKVHMTCDKCRSKALGLVASNHGVESVGIEGDDRDRLAVVGNGLDAANLTACLRKKVAYAELVTVEEVVAKEKKPEPDTTVDPFCQQWHHPGYYSWPYSYPGVHCYPYNM